MYFKVSFDSDFDTLMMHIWSKYGKELFDIDGIGKQCDMNWFAKNFYTTNTTIADASIDSNSNVTDHNVIAYNFEFPKPFQRYNSYYLLWKKLKQVYSIEVANRIVEKQLTGAYYINDFHDIGRPYCFNYSTVDILFDGLPMVSKIKSIRPKYLYSFKSQLEQFVVYCANSTLGATGIADLFISMSYFVDKIMKSGHDAGFYFDGWFSDSDKAVLGAMISSMPARLPDGSNDDEIEKMTKDIGRKLNKPGPYSRVWFERNVWKYVKENIVSLIYTINQPMRGNQSPFSNVSLYDRPFLESLTSGYVFPDESTVDLGIVEKIQNVFIDTMNEELRRTPVTFPVTTACFSVDDENNILDEDFLKLISEKNSEFAFINIYHGKSSTLSSCCRLRSDTQNEYFNSFGAGSTKIGSLGVVTLNLPRLAWTSSSEEDFIQNLEEAVIEIAYINNAKRHIIKKRAENGSLPLYSLGYMDLKKQYSTCGLTGINEVCEILGYDILSESGQAFVLKMLECINSTNDKMAKAYKAPHNCEQVPAENSSIKLATKDKYLGFNKEGYEFYSNQFIPLVTNADMLDRIRLQGLFDNHFSGGAICHLNLGEVVAAGTMADMIRSCAKQGVVYWAVNYQLNKCENGHMSVGTSDSCPVCAGVIVDKYTRVVGFLTNVKNWHKVRREKDFPNRQFYQ